MHFKHLEIGVYAIFIWIRDLPIKQIPETTYSHQLGDDVNSQRIMEKSEFITPIIVANNHRHLTTWTAWYESTKAAHMMVVTFQKLSALDRKQRLMLLSLYVARLSDQLHQDSRAYELRGFRVCLVSCLLSLPTVVDKQEHNPNREPYPNKS